MPRFFIKRPDIKPRAQSQHILAVWYVILRCILWITVLHSCSLAFSCIAAQSKSRYYKERNVQSKKRQAIRRWFVSIRHGRHVLSQCPKQKHFPPVLVSFFNISGAWMPLFRALAKNMAPMTNADESPTNRLTLFPIYLSLFIVSTLWLSARVPFVFTPVHSCSIRVTRVLFVFTRVHSCSPVFTRVHQCSLVFRLVWSFRSDPCTYVSSKNTKKLTDISFLQACLSTDFQQKLW